MLDDQEKEQRQYLEELEHVIFERKKCMLIMGYGLLSEVHEKGGKSRPPKNWEELLKELAAWCYRASYMASKDWLKLDELFSQKALQDVGAIIEQCRVSKEQLKAEIQEMLLCYQAPVIDTHILVVKIPFRGFITTTYDTFIEDAFVRSKKPYHAPFYTNNIEAALRYVKESIKKEPFILKLHGDIIPGRPLTLSDLDLRERLNRHTTRNKDMKEDWRRFFAGSSILFLGFEQDSPDFACLEYLFDEQIIDATSKHWIAVSQDQHELFNSRLKAKYKNIDIIYYSNDEGMKGFLTEHLPKKPKQVSTKKKDVSDETRIRIPGVVDGNVEVKQDTPHSSSTKSRKSTPPEVFILNAPEDNKYRKELEKRLEALKDQQSISIWHDGKIIPSPEPQQVIIDKHIETAGMFLLLVSPDLHGLDQYGTQINKIMERYSNQKERILVIPIIIRPFDWSSTPYRDLPHLPTGKKAISQLDSDIAYKEVVEVIQKAIVAYLNNPPLVSS